MRDESLSRNALSFVFMIAHRPQKVNEAARESFSQSTARARCGRPPAQGEPPQAAGARPASRRLVAGFVWLIAKAVYKKRK